MRLENKVAIVTGGSRGIGLAIAQRLAEEGAQVVLGNINPQAGEAAVRQIGGARFIQTDVSKKEEAERLVTETVKAFSRLDVLVNSAAFHASAPFAEETPLIWQEMFNVNVLGTVFPSQAAVKVMQKQGGGRIVHICSKAAVVGEPGHAAYSASKGAILSLTRAMAVELAPYHITVNCIYPGPVLTDMLLGNFPDPVRREALGKEAPLGRIGQPQDIVGAVALFASDESDWITGQALSVDGTCQC